jgi:TolA-binding protein
MGDAMKRSLCVLGATALMSCLPCASFAEGPTTASPPSVSVISYKMSDVTSDLAKKQTGEPVQNQQKRIVRDLDELIASLEKQCENCRGNKASNKPIKPATMVHGGTGGIGELVDPRESAKDWAKLSARERDRILQSMSEGFPPEYRTVLERYYRRLAQEKTAAVSGDAAQPKTTAPGSDTP